MANGPFIRFSASAIDISKWLDRTSWIRNNSQDYIFTNNHGYSWSVYFWCQIPVDNKRILKWSFAIHHDNNVVIKTNPMFTLCLHYNILLSNLCLVTNYTQLASLGRCPFFWLLIFSVFKLLTSFTSTSSQSLDAAPFVACIVNTK